MRDELRAIPGDVFLQRLDEIINIGRGGQEVIKAILEMFLQRVERDDRGAPLRLFLFTRPVEQIAAHRLRLILIDPKIGFGRPVLVGRAIRTATIADRFNAGESVSELAADYGLTTPEIKEAIRFERPNENAA